jgi:multidrug efflux pump subunit AcrA (membrane-fusion protein)
VVGAQLRQSEAQLALIVDKINRASLTAPYDGIVVAGDLSQQIGAPIELGKELFTIAPLQSYRVILQVDEQEIRHVRTEQQGRLVIMGIASDPIPLTISKVTPIATSQDGKNFFRVEARLAHSSVHLRPGMEGVGKIETGQQQLWWILTHSLTNWLSLMAWKWLP